MQSPKYTLQHTLLSLCALLLAACAEDTYTPYGEEYVASTMPHYLNVDKSEWTSDFQLDIKTNASWTIEDLPEWLTASTTSGQGSEVVRLKAPANDTGTSRSALISIKATGGDWHRTTRETLSQDWKPYLSLYADELTPLQTVKAAGGTYTINLYTNLKDVAATWTYNSGTDWMSGSYYPDTKRVKFTLQPNYGTGTRSAKVTVYSQKEGLGKTFTVTQLSGNLTLDNTTTYNFDAKGGTETRTITPDIDWRAEVTQSWLTATPTSGAAEKEATIALTALPTYDFTSRSAQLLLYKGSNSYNNKAISVIQSARTLKLGATKVQFAADGVNSSTLSVTSNTEWTIKSKPEWLTATPATGSDDGTITLTATPNRSLLPRSGTLVVADSRSGWEATPVTVEQAAINASDRGLTLPWSASSQTVAIEFPNAWSAATSAGWLSMSAYSGTGPADVVISATRNDLDTERTATITLTSEGRTAKITVVQEGQYITLDNTAGEVSPRGGTINLSVSATVAYTHSVDYDAANPAGASTDWVSVTADDKGTHTITVAANPSTLPRNATLRLNPTDPTSKYSATGVLFRIKQGGRSLSTTVSKIVAYPLGGTTDVYTYTADGDVECSVTQATWLALVEDKTAHTFYLVIAENNDGKIRNAELTLRLLNLPEGEQKALVIPISQHANGQSIIGGEDFNDEQEF